MRLYLKSVGLLTMTLLSLNLPLLPNSDDRLSAVAQTVQDRKAEADQLYQKGVQQFRWGQYAEALQSYDRSLKARQSNDRAGIATVLNRMGEVYITTSQDEAAIEVLTRSQTLDRELNNKAGEAESLYLLGRVYSFIKQYPKAIEHLQQALTMQQTLGDRAGQAMTLLSLASVYSDQHLGRKTTQTMHQALTLQDAIQDPYYKSYALIRIAVFYVKQGKLDQAQQVKQQALQIAQGLQAKGLEATTFRVQCLIYFTQNKNPQAIAQLNQAIALNRQVNDQWNLGQNLALLSGLYGGQADAARSQGLFGQMKAEATQSIEVGQAALKIAQELKQPRLEADVLQTLGSGFTQLGDNQKAIELLQASLKIARSVKDLDGEINALATLSVIYVGQGDNRKKLEADQRSAEIAHEQGDFLIEASHLISLADDYSDQPQRALELNQQALATWQKIKLDELSPPFKSFAQKAKYSILNNLSRSYRDLGNYQTAINYAQQNVTTAQAFRRLDLEARALLDLAFLYDNRAHDYPKSIDAAHKALTIAQQIKDLNLEAEALKQLGDSYTGLSDYAAALKAAERSLSIAKQLENPELEKDNLFLLRSIYTAQGQFQAAIATGQQLLTLVQQKNLQAFEPIVLNYLAGSYLSLGNTIKAQTLAQQVIAIAKRGGNSSGIESLGLTYLGQVYKLQGQSDQAITIFQTVIAQAHKDKDFTREVGAALSLASIYESLGSYQKVVATIEPYLSQIRTRNSRPDEARTLVLLGFSYNRLGENQKGKAFVEQGLTIARQIKNPSDESDALAQLSEIYRTNNDYQKALDLAQQSLKIAQTLKSPPLAVNPQSTIGGIYQNLGDYGNSRDYYQQAQATYKQLNNRGGEGQALLNLAGVAFAQRDAEKTIEQSQKALAIFRDLKEPRLVAIAQRILSLGYGESGNETKAMEAAQAYLVFARTVQNPVWEKDALTLSGDLQRKFGKNQAAIATYQQALAIKTAIGVGNNWGIHAGLARTTAMEEPNTAIVFYKQAINGIQDVRRNIEGLPPQLQQSFLQATVDFDGVKTSDIYRQLANLLLSQGRILEAQQTLELLKVQELKDFDRTTRAKINSTKVELDPTEQTIIDKYSSFIAFGQKLRECQVEPKCAELDRLLKLRTDANAEYNQAVKAFEVAIKTRKQEDENNFLDPQNDLSREAQKIVEAQPDTALIYSLVTDDKLWLVLASKGEILRQFEVKVSQAELNSAVVKFRQLMEQCEKRTCNSKDTAELNCGQPTTLRLAVSQTASARITGQNQASGFCARPDYPLHSNDCFI